MIDFKMIKMILSYFLCIVLIFRVFFKIKLVVGKRVGFNLSIFNRFFVLIMIIAVSLSFREYGSDGLFYSSAIFLTLTEILL